ncbi:MAG: choice-of-anchor D domain-containing protein [Rhodocyclaceae bacterium]|nr:MAG: choice-of-anchor D domain-containing protein [Rhodocyclaceae bacterium]
MTISLWLNLPETSNPQSRSGIFTTHQAYDNQNDIMLFVYANSRTIGMDGFSLTEAKLYRNGALVPAGSFDMSDGWEHITVTAKVGSSFGSHALLLGLYEYGGGGGSPYLKGSLDDVRVYSRALSAVEISALAGTLPDAFSFASLTGAPLSLLTTSNTITVSGINSASAISIVGGTYRVNGGDYTAAAGTVNNGNTVTVQQTSSSSFSTLTTATLTIGGIAGTFDVTTQAQDTTPTAFTFTAQTGAALSTTIASNTITVAGINSASAISIAGGTYSINGGAYTAAAGMVDNGNTVTVQQTSSSSYDTLTTATVTIGGVSGAFNVTSLSGPPGAPTGVTANAGNAQATVTFTVPANNGGSTITGYTVSCGGLTGTGAASPITVTSLTNGTAYTCTVTATNASGTSAASTASAGVLVGFSGAWSQTGGPGGGLVQALAIDPATPATLYAGTNEAGIFKSANGGTSWTAINSGVTDWNIHALAIDPITPSKLYARTASGMTFRSTDSGGVWTGDNSTTSSAHNALVIDPMTPSTLYKGTDPGGVFKSTDGGATWVDANVGLTNLSVLALAINPTTPSTIYASTVDDGIFKSTDSGAHWTAVNIGLPSPPLNINALAINPITPTTLYAGTASDGVFKSTDSGANWLAVNNGITGDLNISVLAINPATPSTLYAVAGNGVYKTTNGGATWAAVKNGLTDTLEVYALAISPAAPFAVYAGTGGGGVFQLDESAVGLSASSISFGSHAVASTSATQTLTLTNTGDFTLDLSAVTLGGNNPGDFAKSGTCASGGTVLPAATCTISVTFTPSAPGARSATLTVTSSASSSPNVLALAGTGATVPDVPTGGDGSAPTIPANLTATPVSQSQINLSWTASTDNVGVSAYRLYRNGSLLDTLGASTSYADAGLTGATAYSYALAACDAAGNCSSQSSQASATTFSPVVSNPTPDPPPTCNSPQVLQDGACVTPPPVCVSPQVLLNGLCVNPVPVCVSPQVLLNGACVIPVPVCVSPQVLQDGVCVTPPPTCVAPQVLQNGFCVTPPPICIAPQVLQNGICVTLVPTCVAPQVLQGTVCVTPPTTCTSPQVLKDGACVIPLPTCVSPQVLQNGICVTPLSCAPPQVLQFGACVTPITCVTPQVLQAGVCVTPVTTASQVVKDPAANVSVDSTGALVIGSPTTSAPIVLNSAVPENALVKLQTSQPVTISSGTSSLQYTDQAGSAQLVVRIVNNQPQLEVARGTVQINSPAAGNTISVMSSESNQTVGAVVTQTSGDIVVVVKTENAALVFVDSGRVNYQGPGQSAPVIVYQGESTQLDSEGTLNQLTLGSLNGQKQVPGDSLPVDIPRDPGTKLPKLDGALPRFNNTVSLLDIVGDVLKAATGDTHGQISYDKTSGTITYVSGSVRYTLIALGDVLVELNKFTDTNASATAGGAYALASRGIQMSLSGALGYFGDLQTLVKGADSNGSLNLKATGAIELRVSGGHYVVMPGVNATLPSNPKPLPGFESDASGYAVFRDHLGTLQTLYPAFLDVDTLNTTVKLAIPTIVMTSKGDGTVSARLGAQSYTLRPDYLVDDTPTGHAADSYWQESGMIYLRNADKSSQGFKVQ